MIFSELYGSYYNAVAAVLREACARPVSARDVREIVQREAFGESLLHLGPEVLEKQWQLLRPDGTTPLRHAPTMPLTLLERRWLKAVSMDPRVRLFPGAVWDDPDVEPLFRPEDVDYYDRYTDGDPYADERYIRNFRVILEAVRDRAPLEVDAVTVRGYSRRYHLMPEYLEYSEKDDKFRLAARGYRFRYVNLASVVRCARAADVPRYAAGDAPGEKRQAVLEVADRRNAPERVLMHFAHFEKRAERLGEDRCRVTVTYDPADETELLIRVLSFGPLVRAVGPAAFTDLIRERLRRQRDMWK